MDINRGFTMLLPLAAAMCLLNAKARADSPLSIGAATGGASHVQRGLPTAAGIPTLPYAPPNTDEEDARSKLLSMQMARIHHGNS